MVTAKRRHIRSWDLDSIADTGMRDTVQGALNACRYPFGRIRKNTGKRVPVAISDLSRFAAMIPAKGGHAHVHHGSEEAHLLADTSRRAALGLYWLPTPDHPAGRVELHSGIMHDVPLAQEVFLAEAAHAVDYGVPITGEQKRLIAEAYHKANPHDHSAANPHGWFEEAGDDDYWDWIGESFMSGFMAAFAPKLPRPLEQRQPWSHRTTPEVVMAIRKILK